MNHKFSFLHCHFALLAGLILYSGSSTGQWQISDDFTDNEIASNPQWQGDTGYFKVNANQQLQLNDSVAGIKHLKVSSQISINASWEWWCRLDFNPSSSNYLKVYLVSEQADLTANPRGYFVRIGGSTEDRVSLYRQDQNQAVLLIESSAGWVDFASNSLNIKVTRQADSLWQLYVDSSSTINYQFQGQALDAAYNQAQFFGVVPHFTKTRAQRFYWDDFILQGDPFIDSLPPVLIAAEVIDSQHIALKFSEPLNDSIQLQTTQFELLPQGQSPISVELSNGDSIFLTFSQALKMNEVNQLTIKGVMDRSLNVLDTSLSLRYYLPNWGAVVINELMVDPSPSVGIPPFGLPETEYIELFNTLDWPVSLHNWQLIVGSRSYNLPNILLEAKGLVTITQEEAVLEFGDSVKVLGLSLPVSALPNSAGEVALYSPNEELISIAYYSSTWYANSLKAQGGWSLERVNPYSDCNDKINWRASEDQNGGTPSRVNSVYNELLLTDPPHVTKLSLHDEHSIEVYFNLAMNLEELTDTRFYQVNPKLKIADIQVLSGTGQVIRIIFSEALNPNLSYILQVQEGLLSCAQVPMLPEQWNFGIPSAPIQGDVLINEVLFNPSPGNADFVELYNASSRIFDLSRVYIGSWDEVRQETVNANLILDDSRLFYPGEYLVLCEDGAGLSANYIVKDPRSIIEVRDLPSLPDKEGSVSIQNSALVNLDHFLYQEAMHHSFIDNPEGVSLERLSFSMATNMVKNWHSASSTVKYATPGYENSQALKMSNKDQLHISPKVFSPNLDGYHDVLEIHYGFQSAGKQANILVWNSKGQIIRNLFGPATLSTHGFIVWDGTDDGGNLVERGIYILTFELYSGDEKREVLRKSCVVSH